MKKKLGGILFALLSIALLLPLNNAAAAPKPKASIKVLVPNGGEVYKEGDVVSIKWTTTGTVSNIWIGYSEGTGSLNWIATGLPNSGSYSWTVDVGQTGNTQFKIYTSGTYSGGFVSDYSDNFFTVYQTNPTLTFTADSYNIGYNASTTLRWVSTDTKSCTASGAWSGSKPPSGSYGTGPLTSTRTYTLTCDGKYGGTISKSVTIVVARPPPAPTLIFTADVFAVDYGSSTTLHWNSNNTTSCTASGRWTGSKPLSGSESTGPITSTGTYYLTCYGTGGSVQKSVTITVVYPNPTLSFTADSYNLPYRGSTTLHWSSTGTNTCTASGKWSGSKPTSGTYDTGPLYSTSTYALSCSGAGGTASSTVTIGVSPSRLPVPTISFIIDDVAVATFASTTLRWTSTDASYCTAYYGWQGTTTKSGVQNTGSLASDRLFGLSCMNADEIGVSKEVEAHTFSTINLYSATGTLQQVLDTGKSLNCVNQAINGGKGPATQSRDYLADGNKVRLQQEEVQNDGTFSNTSEYIFFPGTILYTFYRDQAPSTPHYPGDPAYEDFANRMDSKTLSGYTCNEEALDPSIFEAP